MPADAAHGRLRRARQFGSADADVDVVYQRIDAAVGSTVGQLWTTIRKDKAAQARVDA